MKNLFKFSTLFLFAVVIIFSSCSKDEVNVDKKEALISKVWEYEDIDMDELSLSTDDLATAIELAFVYGASKLDFKENGELEMTSLFGETTLKWEFANGYEKIRLVNEEEETDQLYDLFSISESELVFGYEDKDIKLIFK